MGKYGDTIPITPYLPRFAMVVSSRVEYQQCSKWRVCPFLRFRFYQFQVLFILLTTRNRGKWGTHDAQATSRPPASGGRTSVVGAVLVFVASMFAGSSLDRSFKSFSHDIHPCYRAGCCADAVRLVQACSKSLCDPRRRSPSRCGSKPW
jgi:hypothetical protein